MPASQRKVKLQPFNYLGVTTQQYLLLYTSVIPELVVMCINTAVVEMLVKEGELTYVRGSLDYKIFKVAHIHKMQLYYLSSPSVNLPLICCIIL